MIVIGIPVGKMVIFHLLHCDSSSPQAVFARNGSEELVLGFESPQNGQHKEISKSPVCTRSGR